MTSIHSPTSSKLKHYFLEGKVFAYPTEAVFGLGCDPMNRQALERILQLKQRPMEKGVILVADCWERVTKFVDVKQISETTLADVKISWPGFITWLMPKSSTTPEWISGDSELIAIRVSAHPVIQQLCKTLNSALVSTSANLSGQSAIKDRAILEQVFAKNVLYITGDLGGELNASEIRHALTGKIIRGN